MENTIGRFNISAVSNAGFYFASAVVITTTVYKIAQYVFPNSEESKFNSLVAAVGFAWTCLAIRVISPKYLVHELTIPVLFFVGGTLAVAACIFAIRTFTAPKSAEIDEAPKVDKPEWITILKAKSIQLPLFTDKEYQEFTSNIESYFFVKVQGQRGSPYKDVIEFYLSKNPDSVFRLKSSLQTEEDVVEALEQIKNIKTSKKVLWMDDSDLFKVGNDLLGVFRDHAMQITGLKIVYTASFSKEDEPNSYHQIPTVIIQPASKEKTQQMLIDSYWVTEEDAKLIVSFADFLSPALPGSVIQLYADWKTAGSQTTFLDYLALKLKVDPIFLNPTNKKEVESHIGKAKVQMNKDVLTLEPVFDRICDQLLIGLHTQKKTPLASFLIHGVSGSGKTSIAESVARHLFQNNLLRIDLSLLLGENSDFFNLLQTLSKQPYSVVLFEGVDRLYTNIDNILCLSAPVVMNALIAILRGEMEGLHVEHTLIVFTAEKHDMLDETFKSLTNSITLEYGNDEFDHIFRHYFNKTSQSCPPSSSTPTANLELLKKNCPVFEGNVRSLQRFLKDHLLLPALKSPPENANVNLRSAAVARGISLSRKADSFVTRLLPSSVAQTHCLFREEQYQQFAKALRQQKGAILVGPTGSGKSDMIQRLMNDPNLAYLEVIRLNITSFAADSKYLGQFESHVKELKQRISKNKSLLVIEGSALLLSNRADESDYFNFIDHLETALDDEYFRVVITLSRDEYQRLEDRSGKLVSRLGKIVLDPLDVQTSKKLLLQIQSELQKRQSCVFEERAFDTVLRYSHYLKGCLPGSAILFLQSMTMQENEKIDEEKILNSLSMQLNVGLEWLKFGNPDLGPKIASAKLSLKKNIHGQDQQIDAICDLIEVRHKKLSSSPTATLGNFLVMGQPGVGKTYFADLLSKQLFHSNFIRIDMQHLIDPNELIKLTAHGGSLSKLNDHPFSVVLLDEIEKAPREAQDALLGILQDGRFVDKKGHEVRFDHAVIIMTTNALPQHLKGYFTAAFLSRTTPISFNPLSQDALTSIIKDKLEVIKKSCEEYQTNLEFGDSVIQLLVKQFLSEKRNARDADRFLEEKVSLPLTKALKPNHNLMAKIENDNIIFELAR